ncbi:unnamed protein product [Calypogeia fissa]
MMSAATMLSQTQLLTFATSAATTTTGGVSEGALSTRGTTSAAVYKVLTRATSRISTVIPLRRQRTLDARISVLYSSRRTQGVWRNSAGLSISISGGVGPSSRRAQSLASEGPSAMAEEEKVPVVSADWLHQHLNDPNLKVLDASWYMPFDKRNPLQEYKESHIPGALFFDIDAIGDITSEMPHMLPSEDAFSAAASALGLRNDDNIVVYDGKGIFSAARVWWMFRAFGHDKVWVLDGGLPQWLQQKYPVESASSTALGKVGASTEAIKKIYGGEQVDSGVFKAHLQQNLVLSLDEVMQNITEKKYLLVDARSKARFDGSAPEPRQGVRGGHVPGSTCVPFTEVLTGTGALLPAEELVEKFQSSGVSLDSPIAVSCGTGVTACILALALHRLGKADIPVYDGSWTEWGLTPHVPVETNV